MKRLGLYICIVCGGNTYRPNRICSYCSRESLEKIKAEFENKKYCSYHNMIYEDEECPVCKTIKTIRKLKQKRLFDKALQKIKKNE